MTVYVDTPEGVKSGSAVREFIITQGPELFIESGPGQERRGEAVAVDLGKRGVLLATIGTDDEFLVFNTFGVERGGLTREGARYFENLETPETPLALKDYPTLVTFTDMNDPKTVTQVVELEYSQIPDPPGFLRTAKIKRDRSSELFGAGVNFQKITIQMTREPVTRAIEGKLPPFGQDSGFEKWFGRLAYGDPRGVTLDNFQR